MKATMGAQVIRLAIIPMITAVVPQEHRGVATAAAVAVTILAPRKRFKKAETFAASTYSLSRDAITTLAIKNGQLC